MTDHLAPRPVRRVRPVEDASIPDPEVQGETPLRSRRAAPPPHQSLSLEEIAGKSGNYIFSFGNPGSGKTTFQWFLMRYLLDHGDFSTRTDIPDTPSGTDWGSRRLINDWKTQWIEGRFPDSTSASEDDIREITVESCPMQGEKTPCRFSFLEMSGELLRMIDPSNSARPRLADRIHAYLDNHNIRYVMVLLLHPEEDLNDNLFASFLHYLDREHPGIKNRISLAVVVSKPLESLHKLQDYGDARGRRDYHEWDASALDAYVDTFAPEAYQALRSWPDPKRTMMASLNIGPIEVNAGEPLLRQPDFDDISGIYAWIYNQFTGKHLGPTFWQRLFGQMAGWR